MTKTAVLLVNLGTPNSYQKKDVFRYLIQFLTDRRVITLPFVERNLLVRTVIVPSRFTTSAKYYEEIWTEDGSPLDIYARKTKALLQTSLGNDFVVEYAMRYQSPSLKSTLKKIIKPNISKLVVIPLFPQYASSTTGSIMESVFAQLKGLEVFPSMQFVTHFHDHPKIINAFCDIARKCSYEDYDHILLSFHGLPEKQLVKADLCNHCLKSKNCCKKISDKNHMCYGAQCYATAEKLIEKLKLEKDRYSICFQSRLGKDPWLKPSTSSLIESLPKKGCKKVLVMCPSFVCDCLETLHEVAIEYSTDFKKAGGETLHLMPGLNDHPLFIEALKDLSSPYLSKKAEALSALIPEKNLL
ncbi:ferrochelatase [Candidatus Aerophobetes bacterium]|uniref:Ferrochelatase n=1 Tax=Aerophobetes bacterium TaxID=2030807 RepID=A0A2A4YLZ7_UNCAE|nr:MAG: ferrochelatase [Candidatus Aerophobetes bacterium]